MSSSAQPALDVGDGVVLRPWRVDDAGMAMAAFEVPDIQRWHVRRLETIAEARAWIEAMHSGWRTETSATWAIDSPGGGAPVGRMALTRLDLVGGWAEVAYWLLPGARGRGLVTSSLDALARWAIDDLGLHRLELEHSVANPASCGVAERAGFELEGTLRQRVLHADGWHDMHIHSRLAPSTEPT